MYKKLKILSRKSELARIQANLVGNAIKEIYKHTSIEFHTSESTADLDQTIDIAMNRKPVFSFEKQKKISS